jgi:steroid 5-alpha reductase family enzyme
MRIARVARSPHSSRICRDARGDLELDAPHLFATALALCAAAMFALWLVSLALRDASIVDVWWGPGFALIAGAAWRLGSGGDPGRRALASTLVALWGLRLGAYLAWRNFGRGEDPRYQAMRRHWGRRFPVASLFTVFGLQCALMWFVSLPVQAVHVSSGERLGALDAAGAALALVGLFFEAVGDLQLARFRGDPANHARVMDRGLWRYTRHPNYFGDCCVWWGLYAIAAATPLGVWTIASPIAMTFLLLRVSGVALLERSIGRRRPDYAQYAARTSAFVPWPPRRPA